MSRWRQAEGWEITAGAAANYEHGARAAVEVAEELREAIKEMVFNVLPAILWALRWSYAGFPTILNTEILRAEPAFWTLGKRRWSTF